MFANQLNFYQQLFNLQKYYHCVSFICARAMPQAQKALQKVCSLKKTTVLCQSISQHISLWLTGIFGGIWKRIQSCSFPGRSIPLWTSTPGCRTSGWSWPASAWSAGWSQSWWSAEGRHRPPVGTGRSPPAARCRRPSWTSRPAAPSIGSWSPE